MQHPVTLTAEALERCSPWDAPTRVDWLTWLESKEHKRDPRMGELCYLEDPDLLNFDENHVLQCMLPELNYHRRVAKENIQRAAEAYKQRYDARSSVKEHTFDEGDVVWVRTPRPSGQAVGKTDKANKGPYRIVRKVGSVLFKLQDVETGVALSSLKHGDSLTHCPDEDVSRLRVLQRRHGEPLDLGNQERGRNGDRGEREAQRPDQRDEAELNQRVVNVDYQEDRVPLPVTNPGDDVQDIVMIRPSPPRQVKRKIKTKTHSQASSEERTLRTRPGKEKLPAPSTHGMSLRGKSREV